MFDNSVYPINFPLEADTLINVSGTPFFIFQGVASFAIGKTVSLHALELTNILVNVHDGANPRQVQANTELSSTSLLINLNGVRQMGLLGSSALNKFQHVGSIMYFPKLMDFDEVELHNTPTHNGVYLNSFGSFTSVDSVVIWMRAYVSEPKLESEIA